LFIYTSKLKFFNGIKPDFYHVSSKDTKSISIKSQCLLGFSDVL